MQILIDIPEEFEIHFNSDRFEDSLQRVRFDIHKSFISGKVMLSGNYEIETLDMLTEAFLNGTPLPKEHGDLIDRSDLLEYTDISISAYTPTISRYDIITAPTIIPADKEE